MEDYYGYNKYQHPVEAFKAYVGACKRLQQKERYGLPDDWEEQSTLCEGILEYYLLWATNRDEYETVWLDGKPQVEITCHIPLPIAPPQGFDKIVYQFTLDRLVIIEGEYWILDWKFYKQFGTGDLEYDQQMSAYIWAAAAVFEVPIAGGILHEFKKSIPQEPLVLSTGKISTNKAQGTTHGLYRDALINLYGDIKKAPHANMLCLNDLAAQESEDRDNYIRRSRTTPTELQQQAEGTKILMECEDMCNVDLPLYPNPTRDCNWDCSLKEVCLMIDRDDDWSEQLADTTVQRTEESGSWRQYLRT